MQGVMQSQLLLLEMRMKESEARLKQLVEEKLNMIQKTCANEFLAQRNCLKGMLAEQEKNVSDILVSEKKIWEIVGKTQKEIPPRESSESPELVIKNEKAPNENNPKKCLL